MTTVLGFQPLAPADAATERSLERPDTRAPEPAAVPTHLTLAVVCAHVFFRPLGVAAVVSAGQVRTRLALGDIEGARRASRRTLWLCGGSVLATVLFVLVIALGADSYSHTH